MLRLPNPIRLTDRIPPVYRPYLVQRARRAPRASHVPRLLRDSAYERLKQWVLTGELHAGQFLSEAQIAKSLAMSRTPVREALAHLQRDGLVDLVPRRGALIRSPSPKDVDDLFDIRIAVELQALRKGFARVPEPALRTLATRLESQERKLDTTPFRDIEQLSVDVHMAVMDAADNRRIIALIHELREQVYIASTLYRDRDGHVHLGRVRQVIADHREFVGALLARDLPAASAALEAHLIRTKEMVIEALREGVRAGSRKNGRTG